MALPWISRSGLMAAFGSEAERIPVHGNATDRMSEFVGMQFVEDMDPAFASGADSPLFDSRGNLWLGADGDAGQRPGTAGFVGERPRLDYVALVIFTNLRI